MVVVPEMKETGEKKDNKINNKARIKTERKWMSTTDEWEERGRHRQDRLRDGGRLPSAGEQLIEDTNSRRAINREVVDMG